MLRYAVAALAMSAAAGFAQPAQTPPAQPSDQPPAKRDLPIPAAADLFARYTKALGGADAIRARTSVKLEGTLTQGDQFLGLVTMWNIAPDKLCVRIEPTGEATQNRIFNGEYAWQIDSSNNALILLDHHMLDLAQSADMHLWADPSRVYSNARSIKVVDFRGKICFEVQADSIYGQRDLLYFDVDTGLLHGMETKVAGAESGQQVPMLVTQEDFKDIGGVLSPTKLTQELTDGSKFTVTYTSFEANLKESDLPDFTTPQWLLDAVKKHEDERSAQAPSSGG